MKNTETNRYGAVEKSRAVLAVWTERKSAAVLCRELGISAALFCQWQDRALSGMLEALEPRGTREAAPGPALSETMRRLLDRKVRSRQIATLSRGTPWRTRPARSKVPPQTPSPAAAS